MLNDTETIECDGIRKDAVAFFETVTPSERKELDSQRMESNLHRELLKVHNFACARCRNLRSQAEDRQIKFTCTATDLDMVFALRKGQWAFFCLPDCSG